LSHLRLTGNLITHRFILPLLSPFALAYVERRVGDEKARIFLGSFFEFRYFPPGKITRLPAFFMSKLKANVTAPPRQSSQR
jgi:hypothetical protein